MLEIYDRRPDRQTDRNTLAVADTGRRARWLRNVTSGTGTSRGDFWTSWFPLYQSVKLWWTVSDDGGGMTENSAFKAFTTLIADWSSGWGTEPYHVVEVGRHASSWVTGPPRINLFILCHSASIALFNESLC